MRERTQLGMSGQRGVSEDAGDIIGSILRGSGSHQVDLKWGKKETWCEQKYSAYSILVGLVSTFSVAKEIMLSHATTYIALSERLSWSFWLARNWSVKCSQKNVGNSLALSLRSKKGLALELLGREMGEPVSSLITHLWKCDSLALIITGELRARNVRFPVGLYNLSLIKYSKNRVNLNSTETWRIPLSEAVD